MRHLDCLLTIESVLLQIFLPDQVNLDGQWEVAIWGISYPSMYQNVTDGKFLFYDAIYSKMTTAYYL